MANISEILEVPSVLFLNEFSAPVSDTKLRWVMLSPYGDWPNAQGLQRIQKEDAEQIVNSFNSISSTAHRVIGLPFYIGHPDHPDFSDTYKDGKAYGRIKVLEARNDGLWGGVKFNANGEQMIADEAYHGHSVNWMLKEDPKNKGVWRPFKLKSVGFTNSPNIPVPPVTTANEAQRAKFFRSMANLRMMAANIRDEHLNADGTFKGGFDGCIAYMQSDKGGGHSEESAKKICGSIAARVAGNSRSKKIANMRYKNLMKRKSQ